MISKGSHKKTNIKQHIKTNTTHKTEEKRRKTRKNEEQTNKKKDKTMRHK